MFLLAENMIVFFFFSFFVILQILLWLDICSADSKLHFIENKIADCSISESQTSSSAAYRARC